MTERRRARAKYLMQERLASEEREAGSLARCADCGTAIPKRSGSGRRSRFCDLHRPIVLTSEDRTERRRLTVKVCTECATDFTPEKSLKQMYCSDPCGKRASNRAFVQRRPICSEEGCENRSASAGLCRKHHPTAKSWSTGRPETRRKNLLIKTQRRRARLAGDVDAESIDRIDIGDRDGWKCGLCGLRVDRKFAWPSSKSPSLDHIEPVSLGGKHTRTNVQIAHLGCNMAKGNRGGGEQLLLIG